MRKLLENHQAKGDFEIYDDKLKQQFWKYYLRTLIWKVMSPDKSIILAMVAKDSRPMLGNKELDFRVWR